MQQNESLGIDIFCVCDIESDVIEVSRILRSHAARLKINHREAQASSSWLIFLYSNYTFSSSLAGGVSMTTMSANHCCCCSSQAVCCENHANFLMNWIHEIFTLSVEWIWTVFHSLPLRTVDVGRAWLLLLMSSKTLLWIITIFFSFSLLLARRFFVEHFAQKLIALNAERQKKCQQRHQISLSSSWYSKY